MRGRKLLRCDQKDNRRAYWATIVLKNSRPRPRSAKAASLVGQRFQPELGDDLVVLRRSLNLPYIA